MFLSFHGLMLPKETHDFESLKFAHNFTFNDNDVLAVTYPKSGRFSFRLKHVATCYNSKISSKHCDALFPLAKSIPWNRCLDVISCFFSFLIHTCLSNYVHLGNFRLYIKISVDVTRVKHCCHFNFTIDNERHWTIVNIQWGTLSPSSVKRNNCKFLSDIWINIWKRLSQIVTLGT